MMLEFFLAILYSLAIHQAIVGVVWLILFYFEPSRQECVIGARRFSVGLGLVLGEEASRVALELDDGFDKQRVTLEHLLKIILSV